MTVMLAKATEEVKINLTKRGITAPPQDINVSLLLDFSYSMDDEYKDGSVARVLKRLLSISNVIDDDGNLELIIFSNNATHVGTVTTQQYDNVDQIIRNIQSNYSMGGTEYTPAVAAALKAVGTETSTTKQVEVEVPVKPTGLFKRMFGSAETTTEIQTVQETSTSVEGKQLFVLITDGDNSSSDKERFKRKVREIEQMPNVYIQCIAIGCTSPYLQSLANESNSVGYTSLSDFTKTNDELIESIINTELLTKFSKI